MGLTAHPTRRIGETGVPVKVWLALAVALAAGLRWGTTALAGPAARFGTTELVYGQRGLLPGEFQKPRAVAIDARDRVYTVDMKAEISVFDADGKYVASWSTPTHEFGRPSGLAIAPDGDLVAADSHYHQVLVYSPEGQLRRVLGGDQAPGPLGGYFGYIADVALDAAGNFYVAESHQHERITKLSPAGDILKTWGERGPAPGQFSRIRALAFGPDGNLYVADACNHRLQVFSPEGVFLRTIGAGVLEYPFDVAVAKDGTVYAVEWGAGRVQRFSPAGEPTGTWGSPGAGPDQLDQPWALALDSRGRLHVADSLNHRLHRVRP